VTCYPEVAYILAGYRTAGQLAEECIIVPRHGWMELGRSVLDHSDPLEPTDRDRLLDQVREQNAAMRLDLEHDAGGIPTTSPDVPSPELDAGLERGQGGSHVREQDKNRRPSIEDYLKESHDEHEEWT